MGDSLKGLQQAYALYGVPLVREVTLQVTPATMQYWQLVRRKRVAEVVLALQVSGQDAEAGSPAEPAYLVHTKQFYPAGAFRLISGGIEPGEDVLAAVEREALEETGLTITIVRFLALVRYQFVRGIERRDFSSYVFLAQSSGGVVGPTDSREAISGFREVTTEGLLELAQELEALPAEWSDWGRFRAIAHRLAYEALHDVRD